MLWIKAIHVIFIITWFCGLFYLPRLFVYHAMATDRISQQRFVIMERKLYYGIAMPSAIIATLSGLYLLGLNWHYYLTTHWMQIKLACVLLLWLYHLSCIKYLIDFKNNRMRHGHRFFRWFNEIPSVLLLIIVICVIVKPSFS